MPRWLLGFATLGLAASSASTWVHYRLLNDPTYTSVCDVNSTFSCSEAYTSQYGAFGGVPVALLGMLFFAGVAGLVVLCGRSKAAEANLPGYVFAASTIGLAFVLYLGYASYFILGTVCLLCVGTYVAVIGLFLTSGAAAKDPMTNLPARAARDLGTLVRTPVALSATAVFALVAVASVLWFPGGALTAAADPGSAQTPAAAVPSADQARVREFETWLAAQPREPIVVPGDGAAVVIVKFNDYQCPACGQTHREYEPVFAKWAQRAPGKISVIYKDFPLERECNPSMSSDVHLASCEAAVAVRLAREKGKEAAMQSWLYANQPSMTPATVRQAAKDIGGVTDMDARYAATVALVRGDAQQGVQMKITGTPTFFMNGMRLPGLRPEFFDA
ncbi:MAG: thioredoxin domain-containing protein, partial [Acidobacteriota bacterium]|nr:thioredoxin domain-containing protein [Acidobacteriota bacterium]